MVPADKAPTSGEYREYSGDDQRSPAGMRLLHRFGAMNAVLEFHDRNRGQNHLRLSVLAPDSEERPIGPRNSSRRFSPG